tara:strand:- start:1897 stop:2298 length:402 start_codon:yes stop_codon:yes gene_type:complete
VDQKLLWSDFIFPSTLKVASFVEVLLEPIESNEIAQKLQLGLHEALVNAVKHGNCGDPNKKLRVRRILSPNWFIWQVQDEGEGIPFHKRHLTLPSRLESTNGRGLFLISHCFDDIRWSPLGNRLQLASKRTIK